MTLSMEKYAFHCDFKRPVQKSVQKFVQKKTSKQKVCEKTSKQNGTSYTSNIVEYGGNKLQGM